jgi:hypothetical protein
MGQKTCRPGRFFSFFPQALRQNASIGVTLVGKGRNAPPLIFLPKFSLFGHFDEGGYKKIGVTVGGKGCMCIKDVFKPIFALFLI